MSSKWKPYLLLTPALVLTVGIFVGGIAIALIQSFGYFSAIGMREWTLDYYQTLFADPSFYESLTFSLYTAFVSSIVSVVGGLLLALALLKSRLSGRIAGWAAKLPVLVPHSIAAFLVIASLSQSGWLARLGFHLGLLDSQASGWRLLYDRNAIGMILAYLWKGAPFVAMVAFGLLKNVDDKLSHVARNLGASSSQTFRMVVLPILGPTLFSSFLLIFAFSFGAYEIPFLLGPTEPKALPVLAYVAYSNPDLTQRPLAMAINMVLAAFSFLLVGLYALAFRMMKRLKL